MPIAGWIGDLVLDALLTSEGGELCGSPLTLYGSPPAGSINQTVTEQLGIPTVTVETYREEPLARRVQNHLEFVQYVYNMRWMVWGGGKAKQSAYHVFFALTGFAIWRTLRHLRRQSSHRMEISHEERKHREVLIRE